MSVSEVQSQEEGPRRSGVATYALGGLLGGLVGAACVIGVTLALKAGIDMVSRQATWLIIVVPLLGLALAVLALHGIGRSEAPQPLAPGATPPRAPWAQRWRTFPHGAIRSDITGDIVDTCAVATPRRGARRI